MAAKTIFLQGLTLTPAVGQPATAGTIDVTQAVLGVEPTLQNATITSRFVSTIVSTVVEGKAKYMLNRKKHADTGQTYTSLKATQVGPLSTAGFKKSTRDTFEFELDQAWDTNFIYEKKKDPKVREGKMIEDLASVSFDLREKKDVMFWKTLNDDIGTVTANKAKSTKFPKYASSIDDKVVAAPDIFQELDLTAVTDNVKKAESIVDTMYKMVEEVAMMGRLGSAHEGYPYVSGGRTGLGLEFVVKGDIPLAISHDSRFKYSTSDEKMVRQGIVGFINNVAIVRDDVMDGNFTKGNIALLPTGRKGTVMIVQELADSLVIKDHPIYSENQELMVGNGAYDKNLTPYVNLARFMNVKGL